MKTLEEILTDLREPVPPSKIKQKTKGGTRINFISWYDYCDLLDERAGIGGWSWEVRDLTQVGNRLHLTGVLTLIGSDRSLTMMATGTEDTDLQSYGDPSSNAEAMALRRCCAKFGLARSLWRKEKGQRQQNQFVQPVPKGQLTREDWLKIQASKEVKNA